HRDLHYPLRRQRQMCIRDRHYTGPPRIKPRGPMIVLVDTSGSMHGTPQTLAKSAVLAMAKLMLSQQRDMKVILFASTSQHLEIELSSKKRMSEKFLNFLLYTFGGGTDFNTALASGLKSLKEKDFQGADLLFITDGRSEISDELVLARWEEAKKKYNAKVYTCLLYTSDAADEEDSVDLG
ncbi:VWA domain-containing protein, partial [Methanosarcina sp. 2.H.T.1A.15]|uniref:vWA domain-containing protein n=1 Tax=Methanosarcina sp. 2.H.T.1A.15 TaxID=1483596 RepID=UPI00064FE45C